MNSIITAFGQTSFMNLIGLFLLAFVIHELEEWNIDRFERRNFVGLPLAASDRSARMWIGCACLIGLAWCAAAVLPGSPRLAAWIILPATAITLLNAAQHAIWTVIFRQYAPGLATAVLLLIPLSGYLMARAVTQGYVPGWYAAALTALVVALSAQTILAGNQMTASIRAINRIGIFLAERIK